VFDAVRVWKDEELLGRRHCAPTAADDSADNQNVCAKYYHSMYRLVEDEILRVTIVIKCFPIYAASVIKAIFFLFCYLMNFLYISRVSQQIGDVAENVSASVMRDGRAPPLS
jgi:hypothetical protein